MPPALDYATPSARHQYAPSPEATRLFWQGVRKVIFAGGFGLLGWGMACLWAGIERHGAAFAVGWGVTFVVLVFRFPRGVSRARKKPIRRGSPKQCRRRFGKESI
jgi:hypothetical protein